MSWILGVIRLKTILGNLVKKNYGIANYLPVDLLVLILSHLSLKDKIRASAVCKTWHEASVFVRDRSPWLVYFDMDPSGVSYGFFDPIQKKKTKGMKLPDLFYDASICYSRNGWLLMEDYHEGTKGLFFFNPFTREHIKLPKLTANETTGTEFAFSCAPTRKSCVVCGLNNRAPNHFVIHTWYHGMGEWVTAKFSKPEPLMYYATKNMVFSDGYFWFQDRDGLGMFDPIARTCNTIVQVLAPLPTGVTPSFRRISEYKGNIFLVDVIPGKRLLFRVFLYHNIWAHRGWKNIGRFDGLSIFVSEESNIMTYGLTVEMRNNVYVWHSHLNPDRPSIYSLYTRSLCTDPEDYCVESSINNEMHYATWIEPPQNSSIDDFPIIHS